MVGTTTVVHPKVRQLEGLTSLRFVAALFVVLFHLFQGELANQQTIVQKVLGLGYTGVTFFFVLSGFILSYNYDNIDFRFPGNRHNFFFARIARIYPLYLASLLFALIPFIARQLNPQGDPLMRLMDYLALGLAPLSLQAWLPGAAVAINSPGWSISAEFFFYGCFPFLLPRITAAPRLWMVVTGCLWIASSAICYLLWSKFGGTQEAALLYPLPGLSEKTQLVGQFIKFFPVWHLAEFLSGMLAYVFWRGHNRKLGVAPLLCLAAIGSAFLVAGGVPHTLIHCGLSLIVWTPIILVAAQTESKLLTASVSVFLGRVSFALYLVHWPMIWYVETLNKRLLHASLNHLSVAVLTLALSLIAAALGHLVIEEPIRRKLLERLVGSHLLSPRSMPVKIQTGPLP